MKAVAEAPCKMIITGEHFVVHGALALAVAIGRRVRAEVSDAGTLLIESEGFGKLSARERRARRDPVAAVVEALSRDHGFKPNVKIKIDSEVPERSGLGSSASTMVAVAAAVARLKGIELDVNGIIKYAMVGEMQIHGRPSGIDAAACAAGGAVLYKMGQAPRHLPFEGTRSLVVVDSGERRRTRVLIAKVSRMKEKYPSLFSGLTGAATLISELAAERLVADERRDLGRLLTYNHEVLAAVGASNQRLDGVVDLLLALGCHGAKLTGAGGGGFVIGVPGKVGAARLISGLKERGFSSFEATLPREGVRSWLQ